MGARGEAGQMVPIAIKSQWPHPGNISNNYIKLVKTLSVLNLLI